ncbi:hypothetical protein GIB67_035730 [Kingdonia uniflora]|uniref:CRAL-TRIO domain-containing protein n=1 Tax=Kingdonia uniflora TaxID=39325 RepID=A0A7J7LG89_9MAGN|nr:hypothetical protein GIB67_035730 [Kingdonia uniflora]
MESTKQYPVVQMMEGESQEDNMKITHEIEQKKKVAQMRVLVEKQDPISKEMDDMMIRRFLRARDLDIEKASTLFLKYLKWRQTFMPSGSISASEIPNELAQRKMFLQGHDKLGRPVSVVFGGRHIPNKNKGGLDEFKRFVVFTLEKIIAWMPRGQEKFVGIADCEGWGYSNCDIRAYVGALSILQIMFVENKKLKSTLLQDIDENQIPEIYGGKLPLVPIQDSL